MKISKDSHDRASQLLDPIEHGLVYNTRVTPHWIGGTDSFWFKRYDPQGSTFLFVSPTEKTARPAFDHKKLASALSTALPGNTFSEYTLPFHDFRYAENQTKIEFSATNVDWSYDLVTFQLSR